MSTKLTDLQSATALRERNPAQVFALLSAVVYLAAGVIGFIVTGFEPVTGITDEKVIILAVNPLHNVIHLALGGIYLAGALNADRAREVNMSIGVFLLVAFVLGIVGGGKILNIDGVAEPDNWLHIGWGVASLYYGRGAVGRSKGFSA